MATTATTATLGTITTTATITKHEANSLSTLSDGLSETANCCCKYSCCSYCSCCCCCYRCCGCCRCRCSCTFIDSRHGLEWGQPGPVSWTQSRNRNRTTSENKNKKKQMRTLRTARNTRLPCGQFVRVLHKNTHVLLLLLLFYN